MQSFADDMYQPRTFAAVLPRKPVLKEEENAMKPYPRHIKTCAHRGDRNWHRCGCPIWAQDKGRRYSLGTSDWKEAARLISGDAPGGSAITLDEAVELYLTKRGKGDPGRAPQKDRRMLRLLKEWAASKGFLRLDAATASALDAWRDTWALKPDSYSMKVHSAVVKAFFAWAVRFDHIAKSPYDRLEAIRVEPTPTLPLAQEEVSKLLSAVDAAIRPADRARVTAWLLLMRWSGLAVQDAGCLRRDALDSQNRLRTHRMKTGEFVHVKLPAFVADMLRSMVNIKHKDYFFWDGKKKPHSQVNWMEHRLRKLYDHAGISPTGAHRLRDTFAVENLNAGVSVEELAPLLGHSDITTTQRHYMPWVKSRQVRLDAAVDRSLAAQGVPVENSVSVQ
jgi:integrase/recombinase XerD